MRVVVSYDVMTSRDDELQRVTDYLTGAHAQGIEPLVTFEHARCAGDPARGREKKFGARRRGARQGDVDAAPDWTPGKAVDAGS